MKIENAMNIDIPDLACVVLIGPSGAGKSTFAQRHFRATEVVSSDTCRGLVGDDENDQSSTNDAFEVLQLIAAKRLKRGKLVVIDATNVQPESRKPYVELAKATHCLPIAIVLNLSAKVCQQRNSQRPNRNFPAHVVRHQRAQLRRSLRNLKREGFRKVFILETEAAINEATVSRVPLWNDKRAIAGPFDIIGDVHGCADELEQLLRELGYSLTKFESETSWSSAFYQHPEGRRAIFVGDLVDRGPRIIDSLKIVSNMVDRGTGFSVAGNHDAKLLRYLQGKKTSIRHGLAESIEELDGLPEASREPTHREIQRFLSSLISHYVFDRGKLVVAHAGLKEEFHGRASGRVREFAMYGETTGETDEFGLPVRHNWAADYRGAALVVYGHTPVPEAQWLNHTVNVDTGCVFGGKLTAIRYPELETHSVEAHRRYCEPKRPLNYQAYADGRLTAQQAADNLVHAQDVLGKRVLKPRDSRPITIHPTHSAAAFEVISRYAVDPHWLIYLPPTMSPPETSPEQDYLEHPEEAFRYFQQEGVRNIICQEKHMGSRATVVVCESESAAQTRIAGPTTEVGVVYTRTGRPFFTDKDVEREFLERIQQALTSIDFWSTFQTSWVCLDGELMPWSAKAMALLQQQYAAVGAAGTAALKKVIPTLHQAAERYEADELAAATLANYLRKQESVEQFVNAYQRFCWPVNSIQDLKFAPFHLLATEANVHLHQSHLWHMEQLNRLVHADPRLLQETSVQQLDLGCESDWQLGIDWWQALTNNGGEGMVVKPLDSPHQANAKNLQPAIKCRGREYLRIIYGPEYAHPDNLSRLKKRNLGRKRALAIREHALGLESLHRFVEREPLRRIHECVFGVLALESEPVDPRL